LVPVFVFKNGALERGPDPEGWQCVRDDWKAFLELSADQAYVTRTCDLGELQGLTLDDFRLFQDGNPQEIGSVEKASFNLPVRDNRNRHYETSTAPSSFWSTTDIAGQILLPASRPYYLLAYAPVRASLNEGCHRVRVEVNRPGVRVWARDEYCEGQTSSDLLNGTKIGKKLESERKRERARFRYFSKQGHFAKGAANSLRKLSWSFPGIS